MSCTLLPKAAKLVWAKQLTWLPGLVVFVKVQFVYTTKRKMGNPLCWLPSVLSPNVDGDLRRHLPRGKQCLSHCCLSPNCVNFQANILINSLLSLEWYTITTNCCGNGCGAVSADTQSGMTAQKNKICFKACMMQKPSFILCRIYSKRSHEPQARNKVKYLFRNTPPSEKWRQRKFYAYEGCVHDLKRTKSQMEL